MPTSADTSGSRAGIRRLLRFAVVGIAGAANYYLLLLGMVTWLGVGVMTATSIGFALVVLQNYLLHRVWTFESDAPHEQALPRYIAMSVTGFTINWGVMYAGTVHMQLDFRWVQAVAIVLVVSWNYGASRRFVFSTDAGNPRARPPGS